MKVEKERLDILLVEQGFTASRSRAQALILAGEVLVDGQAGTKSGMKIPRDAQIKLKARPPYVSRGGYKLVEALDRFEVAVSDLVCADVGASTGGFTDVMLQRGARIVYAVDVGYGQLDWKLRNDDRVVVLERTNARYLESLPQEIGFASVDVSFISLKLILPQVRKWMSTLGQIIALVKPQFEAGREKVKKGGVVRDKDVHVGVLKDISSWSANNNLFPAGLVPSPIHGASGNREFLLLLRRQNDHFDLERAISHCIEENSY